MQIELLDEIPRGRRDIQVDFLVWLDFDRGVIERAEDVEHHLAALTEAFNAAKAVIKTPFFFASEISDIARPLSIDGSRALIESGFHREAIFWIIATYSRCQKVLYHDAPMEMRDRFSPGYMQLLRDVGITMSGVPIGPRTIADLQQRSEQVKELLPRLWEVAEAIIAANPEIEV